MPSGTAEISSGCGYCSFTQAAKTVSNTLTTAITIKVFFMIKTLSGEKVVIERSDVGSGFSVFQLLEI